MFKLALLALALVACSAEPNDLDILSADLHDFPTTEAEMRAFEILSEKGCYTPHVRIEYKDVEKPLDWRLSRLNPFGERQEWLRISSRLSDERLTYELVKWLEYYYC